MPGVGLLSPAAAELVGAAVYQCEMQGHEHEPVASFS